MIREIAIAIGDLVTTLSSHEKKYGNSTKQELQSYGQELGDQLAALRSDDHAGLVRLFLAMATKLDEKGVPRFGEMVVGSSMYKRLRQLGFKHPGAQAAVDLWDSHTNK